MFTDVTHDNSVLTTRTVTAVLPHVGAVAWTTKQLDAQAVEWWREHAPVAARAWQLPWLRPTDLRTCAGCPNHVPWQQCPYALWTRLYQVQRRTQGVSLPVP